MERAINFTQDDIATRNYCRTSPSGHKFHSSMMSPMVQCNERIGTFIHRLVEARVVEPEDFLGFRLPTPAVFKNRIRHF